MKKVFIFLYLFFFCFVKRKMMMMMANSILAVKQKFVADVGVPQSIILSCWWDTTSKECLRMFVEILALPPCTEQMPVEERSSLYICICKNIPEYRFGIVEHAPTFFLVLNIVFVFIVFNLCCSISISIIISFVIRNNNNISTCLSQIHSFPRILLCSCFMNVVCMYLKRWSNK